MTDLSSLPTNPPSLTTANPSEEPTGPVTDSSGGQTQQAQFARTARNLTAIAASTLITNAAQFGWVVVMTNLLGASKFGVWGNISALLVIAAALPEFGMGVIVLRDVAQQPTLGGKYLTATLTLQPLLAMVAGLILIAVTLILPYNADVRALAAVATITLIMDTFGNMAHNQLLAIEQMIAPSLIRLAYMALYIAFGGVILLRGGGLFGFYLAAIVASAFRGILYWLALRHYNVKPIFPPDRALIRYILTEGAPIALAAFIQLVYRYINTVIVGAFTTAQETAYLTTANVIVFGVVELTSSTLLVALSPMMARLAFGQVQALRDLVEKFAFLTFVAGLPLGIGIALLSGNLIGLLFKPEFAGTIAVLQILIWLGVLSMITDIFGQSMVVQGRQRRLLMFRVVGVVVTIVLNFIFLPLYLSRGAALALLGAQAILITLLIVDHHMDAVTARRLGGKAIRVIVAGVLMALVIVVLRTVNFVLAGTVGGLVYLSGLIFFRALAPEHWSILRSVTANIPLLRRFV